jgi:hypothetical protein
MFEWDINKDIAGIPHTLNMEDWEGVKEEMETEKGCGVDSLMRKSDDMEFEESYQQFRLMVSNWITGERGGAELRAKMEDIMFNRTLPEYEKRKRMFLLIGSILVKWFYADEEMWDKGPANFLRKDCNLITQARSCTGTCVWREEENKCLLHVHALTNLGSQEDDEKEPQQLEKESREVSTPQLFTKRVIDELIRFPARRKQIMSQGKISKLSTILQPIRQGDQYIIPESSPTWTNLHLVARPKTRRLALQKIRQTLPAWQAGLLQCGHRAWARGVPVPRGSVAGVAGWPRAVWLLWRSRATHPPAPAGGLYARARGGLRAWLLP